jgi:hypothetical protein
VFSLVFKLGNMLYLLNVGLHYNWGSNRLLVLTTAKGFYIFIIIFYLHSSIICTVQIRKLHFLLIQFRLRF